MPPGKLTLMKTNGKECVEQIGKENVIRNPETTDAEWEKMLAERKKIAEDRMQREDNMKGLMTYPYLQKTAAKWGTNLHAAEIRLMSGEMP